MAADLPDEVYLNVSYLNTLKRALAPVADKWYSFGEALKVEKSTLDGLGCNKMDSSTQLLLVLSHYLSGTAEVPYPTRRGMVAALREANFNIEANAVEKCDFTTTSRGKIVYIHTYHKSTGSQCNCFRSPDR